MEKTKSHKIGWYQTFVALQSVRDITRESKTFKFKTSQYFLFIFCMHRWVTNWMSVVWQPFYWNTKMKNTFAPINVIFCVSFFIFIFAIKIAMAITLTGAGQCEWIERDALIDWPWQHQYPYMWKIIIVSSLRAKNKWNFQDQEISQYFVNI